jgi:hypothetical protein
MTHQLTLTQAAIIRCATTNDQRRGRRGINQCSTEVPYTEAVSPNFTRYLNEVNQLIEMGLIELQNRWVRVLDSEIEIESWGNYVYDHDIEEPTQSDWDLFCAEFEAEFGYDLSDQMETFSKIHELTFAFCLTRVLI